MAPETTVIERVVGSCGELVLQRRDGHYEIVANGVFLMDTRVRRSELLQVTAAADRMPPPGRMLIGGLGVGFALAAALAHPGVGEVHVLEWEPAVLRWNRGRLAPLNGDALGDRAFALMRQTWSSGWRRRPQAHLMRSVLTSTTDRVARITR